MERRNFIKSSAAFLAGSIMGAPLLDKIVKTQNAYAQAQQLREKIVHKSLKINIIKYLPKDKVRPLEKILEEEPQKPNQDVKELSISYQQYPRIAYALGEKNTLFEMGNITLLNSDGFFVTPAHVVGEKKEGILHYSDNQMRYYDPINDMILNGNILSISTDLNLALGKLKVPGDYPAFSPLLPKVRPQKGIVVYSLTYSNIDFILYDLFNKINETIQSHPNNPSPLRLREDVLKTMRYNVTFGVYTNEIHFGRENPKIYRGPDFFIGESQPGNSGSPVFDLDNSLRGIVNSIIIEDTYLVINGEREKASISLFINAFDIRKILTHYVSAVCSK